MSDDLIAFMLIGFAFPVLTWAGIILSRALCGTFPIINYLLASTGFVLAFFSCWASTEYGHPIPTSCTIVMVSSAILAFLSLLFMLFDEYPDAAQTFWEAPPPKRKPLPRQGFPSMKKS